MSFVRRRWGALLLAGIVLWVVIAAALSVSAYGDAMQGKDALSRVQERASVEDLRDGSADADLREGAAALRRAHFKLSNPLMQPFRLLPVAGRQLSSAIALTETGHTLADVAVDALPRVRALGELVHADRPRALEELASIAADGRDRLNAVDLGPDEALIGPLATARAQIADPYFAAKTALNRGAAGAEALSQLFSEDAKHLVIVANNAEMRAGTGMFLSVGTLESGDGRISLGNMQTIGKVNPPEGSVDWPRDLERLWGWVEPKADFRSLMLSPRFDVSAALAADMWEAAGNDPVDGVMVIDPLTLKAVLAATGPVNAGGFRVSSDNVLTQLLIEQYRTVSGGGSTVGPQAERREALDAVADAAFDKLNAGEWDPVVLARELGSAAEGRHFLFWSKDPAQNELWQTAGVGGTLRSNSMMLSSANVGANKLDQFLNIDSEVNSVEMGPDRNFTVTVTVRNEAPINAPRYVVGPTPGLGLEAGEYQGLLSLNVPGDARNLRFDGDRSAVAFGPDGPTQVIATRYTVERGETERFVLHFSRPVSSESILVEPSARIPPTNWTFGDSNWTDDRRKLIVP